MRGVIASGGIGDLIISLPILKRLREDLGRFTVYTLHRSVLDFYLGWESKPIDYELVRNRYVKWDYLIHVTNFAWFMSAQLKGPHLHLLAKNNQFIHEHKMVDYIDQHPHYDGQAADEFLQKGFNRMTLSQAMLGYEPMPLIQKKIKPHRFWLKNYLTVHWGVGDNHAGHVTRPTKTWDISHFETLIAMIKHQHPKLGVVQLGSSLTGHKLKGVDACFFGLNIEDSFRVLAGSRLHIDGDSGLTHAATSFGVKCIVLFGPTPKEYFGHAENINLNTQVPCSPCWWSTDTWVAKCPKGYKAPVCMNLIFPDKVFQEVEKCL